MLTTCLRQYQQYSMLRKSFPDANRLFTSWCMLKTATFTATRYQQYSKFPAKIRR